MGPYKLDYDSTKCLPLTQHDDWDWVLLELLTLEILHARPLPFRSSDYIFAIKSGFCSKVLQNSSTEPLVITLYNIILQMLVDPKLLTLRWLDALDQKYYNYSLQKMLRPIPQIKTHCDPKPNLITRLRPTAPIFSVSNSWRFKCLFTHTPFEF